MVVFQILKQKLDYIFKTNQFNGTKKLHDVLDDSLFTLDEITCNDIAIDEIFQELNNNLTTYGEELFNHWLRSIKKQNELLSIQNDTRVLGNSIKRENIEKNLKKVGNQSRGNIISDLWNGFEIDSFLIRNLFQILIINSSLLIFFSLVIPNFILLWIFLFTIINLIIYLNTNTMISQFSGSINYILLGVKFIKKVKKQNLDILTVETPKYNKFKHLQWCTLLFRARHTNLK